jgi:hypothetical protein
MSAPFQIASILADYADATARVFDDRSNTIGARLA